MFSHVRAQIGRGVWCVWCPRLWSFYHSRHLVGIEWIRAEKSPKLTLQSCRTVLSQFACMHGRVSVLACVCVHQSPASTHRSFPMSLLYHSISAFSSLTSPLATCLYCQAVFRQRCLSPTEGICRLALLSACLTLNSKGATSYIFVFQHIKSETRERSRKRYVVLSAQRGEKKEKKRL